MTSDTWSIFSNRPYRLNTWAAMGSGVASEISVLRGFMAAWALVSGEWCAGLGGRAARTVSGLTVYLNPWARYS
jgi:hypothetical protein